ncbi:glycosyltransferase [Nocardioides convexus]|uniref:glycosyltransferase n=1 Tax=Nocardioides convexus TaxID=2712224 RepID=UPI0024183B2F|nr:glycosyltransferase [Nocardioides convexus]
MEETGRRRIAYVLPVYNEEENIAVFHAALVEATAQRPDLDFEFVYVDDGSRDASLERLVDLRAEDPRVTVVQFSRNYGHQARGHRRAGPLRRRRRGRRDRHGHRPAGPAAGQPGDDPALGGGRRGRLRPASYPQGHAVQAGDRLGLLLGAGPAGLDRDPAQRRRLPADGRQGGHRGLPLPRARPVPARHRRPRRLPAGGAALRPRRALRGGDRLPAEEDAQTSPPAASSASPRRR